MGHYKKEWLEKKFLQHGIHHRDSWKVVAEVRDLNDTKGRSIPILVDADTGEVKARTDKEKVEYINQYQHRFNQVPPKSPHYCWDLMDVMPVPEYKETGQPPAVSQHRDHEPAAPVTRDPVRLLPTWIHSDDQVVTDTDYLEDHFKRWVYHRTRKKWFHCKRDHKYYSIMLNSDITIEEIKRALSSFSNHKAAGPDKIDIKMLKKGGSVVEDMLLLLFNQMFSLGYVPLGLKERWIIPIMKPGKPGNIPKNLRPISLTSYIGKVYEKILVYRMVTYLVRLRLLESVHFAYLSGRSTTDCIVYIVDRITRNLNRNIKTHGVFFDFSSAFDTVQLNLLLWKLRHEYFMTGRFIQSLAAFLCDRRSAVKINGFISSWLPDVVGVPQGGSLSPILFLIYIDGLGLVNNIPGLTFGIFADDLAVFTSFRDSYESWRALQNGILFIQWYTLHHGLFLNQDKTQYKLFQASRTIHRDHKLSLYFSGSLITAIAPGPLVSDSLVNYESGAVKYLGIWLDTNMSFKFHAEKVKSKVMRLYYTINRNLRKLWSIKAEIVWTIMDTCLFSIFDYSAVVYPMMKKGVQGILVVAYNRLIRSAFNCTRGTRILDQLKQVGSFTLHHRMYTLVAQYFSQMIRTPRSGILYSILRNFWWNDIRYRCVKRHQTEESLSGRDHYKEQHKTIIWHIVEAAIQYENDDALKIDSRLQLKSIPGQISYYMDLTLPWKYSGVVNESFQESMVSSDSEELFIFTDGSVGESGSGGYGYHIIPERNYCELVQHMQDGVSLKDDFIQEYQKQLQGLNIFWHIDRSEWLSDRCSIDFCEAYAIRDSLIRLTYELRHRSLSDPVDFKTVRVISDSQTVLNWISGSYCIRNPVMKGVLDDIIWQMASLKEEFSVQVMLQWVKSHQGTFGNEWVDHLAKKGMGLVEKDTTWKYNRWSWISLKAAKHTVLARSRVLMAVLMHNAIMETEHSHLWRSWLTAGNMKSIEWRSSSKYEIRFFTRNEIRLLIGLRSGHLKLRGYLFHRLKRVNSPDCLYCQEEETIEHVVRDCRKPAVYQQREIFLQLSQDLHQQQYQEDVQCRDFVPWVPLDIDHWDLQMHLFGTYLDRGRHFILLRNLIHLVRIGMIEGHCYQQ